MYDGVRLAEPLAVELGSPLGAAGQEGDDGVADEHRVSLERGAENVCERAGFGLRLVCTELQLLHVQLFLLREELLDPVPRRVHLDAVARVRRDERPAAAVLLHTEVPLRRAPEHRLELLLVERDSDVVDPRNAPVARLDDDVDRAPLQLGKAWLEAVVVELLPRRPGLDRYVLLADTPVARDEVEPELAEVTRFDVAELGGDQVVVEELHVPILPSAVDPPLLTPWSLDPLQVVPTVVVALLYLRRTRTLAQEGRPVAGWRQVSFWTGIALVVLALNSPIDSLGEEHFFFLHMTQHVILGDLAPLCFMVGMTGQILRPVLALSAVEKLRVLAHPLIALPLWAVSLYIWHIPSLYDGALHHTALHALEHLSFFTFGCLMWEPVVETLPAPMWFGTGAKIAYLFAVRLIETVLGNIFIWSSSAFYSVYRHAPEWGITPRHDLNLGGIVMMAEGSVVTLAALVWLFLRMASEGETRQLLLEQGLDPRQVKRAVRYGRAKDLGAPR